MFRWPHNVILLIIFSFCSTRQNIDFLFWEILLQGASEIADSKLSSGVNVRANSGLSLPAMSWRHVEGVSLPSPSDIWNRLQQTPVTQSSGTAGMENGWIKNSGKWIHRQVLRLQQNLCWHLWGCNLNTDHRSNSHTHSPAWESWGLKAASCHFQWSNKGSQDVDCGLVTAYILLGGLIGELLLKYWFMNEDVAEIKTTRNTALQFCSITSWVRAGWETRGALTQGLAHWFESTFSEKSILFLFMPCEHRTFLKRIQQNF